MKVFIVLVICVLSLVGNELFDKNLKSEVRAEVYAQNLVDGGFNKDSKSFLKLAVKKYPNNETLLMFSGTTYYRLKDLEIAKIYFIRSLEVNPANEQAAEFITLIETQESSKENKTVSEMLDYLNDKGLDFLMIFLAFLGSELIAKKHNECSRYSIYFSIRKFKRRNILSVSIMERLKFISVQCCFTKSSFSLCKMLDILVNFTIVIAFMIIWLIIEFLSGYALFLEESISIISAESLWEHVSLVFIVLLGLTLSFRLIMKVKTFDKDKDTYILEVVEQLEYLYEDKSYMSLHKAVKELSNCHENEKILISKHLNLDVKKFLKEHGF